MYDITGERYKARYVYAIRQLLGLRRKDVAMELHVSFSTVDNVETGLGGESFVESYFHYIRNKINNSKQPHSVKQVMLLLLDIWYDFKGVF